MKLYISSNQCYITIPLLRSQLGGQVNIHRQPYFSSLRFSPFVEQQSLGRASSSASYILGNFASNCYTFGIGQNDHAILVYRGY